MPPTSPADSSALRHRRQALLAAAGVLVAYAVSDVLHRAGAAAAVARWAWIAVTVAAALAQRPGRRRLADAAARLLGLASGIASTVIVAGYAGADRLYFGFGFLYAVPFILLVLVPDLPSCAGLAGLGAALGGVALLARCHRPATDLLDSALLSATLGSLAAWGTLVYRRAGEREDRAERDRLSALDRLRASEEKLSAAFEASALGAMLVETDGRVSFANPAIHAMLGERQLVGRRYLDLLHPDDAAEAARLSDRFFAGEALPPAERRFLTSSGRIVYGSVRASGIRGADGRPASSVVLVDDITERKRLRERLAASEALFRDLAERALVGVYLLSEGRLRYVNPRMAEIFGCPRESMLGRPLEVSPEPGGEAPASGAPPASYEGTARRADGAMIQLKVLGAPTTYRDAPAVIGTLLDITGERRAEQDRLRVQKLESLGVLAGGIAHDFNNLLASILGNLSFARERSRQDPELAEALAESEAAAARARELTGQLLTFSRGGKPVRRCIALEPVLRSSSGFAVRGSKVLPSYDLPPELWAVEADEGQVAQVVHNLVLNAVQAMPGGGALRIAAANELVGPAERWVRVSVSDVGPGIPPAVAARIFDPYFTTKSKGTGLGLATAQSIVRRHGGRMEVESVPGQGATFRFWLPAAGRGERAAPPEAPAPLETGEGRVVVMDDDAQVRRALARMLKRLGFEGVETPDGAAMLEAVEAAEREGRPFAAAILDLTIPGGMGGEEAVRLLRERAPGVKAIASSGYSEGAVMAEHAQHGFAGVLAKPYRLEELARVLRQALGGEAEAA